MTINEHYFLDNYGKCDLQNKCKCLREGWKGRGCPYWRPLGVTSLKELEENFLKQVKEKND